MPDIDLPHERISLCHHAKKGDDREPQRDAKEGRIDRQYHKDQNDGGQARYQDKFAISAKQQVRP